MSDRPLDLRPLGRVTEDDLVAAIRTHYETCGHLPPGIRLLEEQELWLRADLHALRITGMGPIAAYQGVEILVEGES